MRLKITLFVLLVGMLLLSGCEISDEDIKAKLVEANSNLDYYSMDMKMSMSTQTEFLGQKIDVQTDMEAKGDIDRLEKKLGMESMITTSAQGMKNEMESDTYILGDFLYTKIMGSWVKMSLEQDLWNKQDQIEQTINLIESSSTERLEDETIDGRSYYVIKIIPDPAKLTEIILKQLQDSSLMQEMKDSLSDMVDEYSSVIWVNKKTFIIERTRTDMKMSISPDDLGAEGTEGSSGLYMDSVIEMQMHNIGVKPEITLPEEAIGAIDLTALQEAQAMQQEENIQVEYN